MATTTGRGRRKDGLQLPPEGIPLWVETGPGPAFPALSGDLEVDVAVIGGGITGLTAATLLKAAGQRVAVLEARKVAQGVTGRTTAHLTQMLDCSLSTLISNFGEDDARLALQSVRAAIEHIARTITERKLDCDFRRLPGYLFTETDEGRERLEEEHEAAHLLGLKASLVTETPLPFPVRAALRLEDQAQFHPRRYLMPLAARLAGGGSHVFEQTRVVDVEDGDPCEVETEQGRVKAKDVVMATHVPLNKVFLQTKVAHYRSYVLAARIEGAVPDGLFWDDEDPYHYVRGHPLEDGELLIVGGEDHKVGQEEDTVACYERLLDYVRRRFRVASVDYRWSAQVAEPVDGLPYIGRNTGSEHVYVATGYSGTGITFGTVAALLISDLVLGQENPWEALYHATRVKPVAAAKDYVAENVDFPVRLVVDRLKTVPDVASLAKGEGKLVDLDGKTVAAYRNESGALIALSPVCTHLKCLVQWNPAEKSWDCPCHGSRFDPEGEVLNGPAVAPLERLR